MSEANTPPLMDWAKVAEEMPHAYCEWYAYFGYQHDDNPELSNPDKIRFPWLIGRLLAFFWEQGIPIDLNLINEEGNKPSSGSCVWLNPYHPYEVKHMAGKYENPKQSLAAAFTEAFKILERRLNEDN